MVKALPVIARARVGASTLDYSDQHVRIELFFRPPSRSASIFFFDATLGYGVSYGLLNGRGIFVREFGLQMFPCGFIPRRLRFR